MSRLTQTVPEMAAAALNVLNPAGNWSAKRHSLDQLLAEIYNQRSSGADLSRLTSSRNDILAALANLVASRSDLTAKNTSQADLLAIIRNAQTTDPDLSALSSSLGALWDGALSLTGAAWSPANLGASLYAFWDAEATANITLAATKVSAWVDSTSNVYSLTNATDAQRPVYSATSFNGRPGITLTKANTTFLQRTGIGSLPTGATACDIWMLVDQTLAAADTVLGVLFNYGAANAYRRVERVVSSAVNRAGGRIGTGAAATASSNATVDFSGKHVLRLRVGATATQTDVDGTAGGSTSITPATSGGNINFGRSDGGGSYGEGVVNAILITDALTGTNESNLLAYLKARGGIA